MNILDERKEQLLTSLLRALVFLGAIAYVPSMYAALKEQLYVVAVVDTLAYAGIAFAVFLPGTSYRLRLFLTVSMLLLVGGTVFFYTGTEGAGYIWLLCAVVISALFGRVGAIVASIAVSEAFMGAYAVLFIFNVIEQSTPLLGLLAISSNFLLIAIALSLITYQLLKVLKAELDARERLLQFLHHRVKNNLQTVESLLAIELEQDARSARIARRIEAISAANELLMNNPGEAVVDLYDMVRSVLRAGIDTVEGEGLVLLPPERITEISVGISDVLHSLKTGGPLKVVLRNRHTPAGRDQAEIEVQVNGISPQSVRIEDLIHNELLPQSWLITDTENQQITISIPSENRAD